MVSRPRDHVLLTAAMADAETVEGILMSLDEAGKRRRDRSRIGRKVGALATLARAGMPVPAGWVLDSRHFDAFIERCLPRKHDLKSLIKLAGTRAGDERCARAYEEMLSAPLDETIEAAVSELFDKQLRLLTQGVAVRPSLVANGRGAGAAAQHLHSRVGLASLDAILRAIREVWASAVLSHAVGAYARAGLKTVSVAVLLQEAVAARPSTGLLTRTTGVNAPIAGADWHLGVLLQPKGPTEWRRRAQLLLPLSVGEGGAAPPAPLQELRDALGPAGFEKLVELGAIGETELGSSALLEFALERGDDTARLTVLNADDGPRWAPLEGGDETTTWTEITLGGRSPEPPTRLTQSVVERVVNGTVEGVLASVRCKIDSSTRLVANWSGRSYLNVDALVRATRDVPLLSAEDLLYALGGVGAERSQILAGRAAATSASTWRLPFITTTALTGQVTLESDVRQLERAIERDARGLGDMDLTLLPSDALGTTLTSAQALLERAAELWGLCTGSLLGHRVAARRVVRRRIPDADVQVGYTLATGAERLFTTAMASSLRRAVDVIRRDEEAVARIRAREVHSMRDLPDGPARGALGQFLSIYGDLCVGAFELAEPRWRDDATDVARLVALLLDAGPLASVDELTRQSRAHADAELARYEPVLSRLERRGLRAILDRAKEILRMRARTERLLFRALRLVRGVVLDIDRRLRRIDPTMAQLGTFHCSAARLAGSLKSGRPELSRVIKMRVAERRQMSGEPAPPLSFVASPPRGAIPIVSETTLRGIGASPGVVEGRVRLMHGAFPAKVERGDILVGAAFDPAMSPLCLVAGGFVAETGGALTIGAETAREMSMPFVSSVEAALLHLGEGERVRIDGTAGTVQRLDMPVASLRAPREGP